VNIPRDLLALMNSLPQSFKNFRCVMESRDVLSDFESLRVKIIKEFEAKKDDVTSKAIFAKRYNKKCRRVNRKNDDNSKDISDDKAKRDRAKLKCYRCKRLIILQKTAKYKRKRVVSDANLTEHTGLCAKFKTLGNGSAIKA